MPLGVAQGRSSFADVPEYPRCSRWSQHSWATAAPGSLSQPCSHLPAQHLPPNGAQQHPLTLRKEPKKAAEETVQQMQIIRCRYPAGTRRDLQFKEGPSCTQAGLHGPYTTPCPSVRPSWPSTCGSRPGRGCCEWGAWGL